MDFRSILEESSYAIQDLTRVREKVKLTDRERAVLEQEAAMFDLKAAEMQQAKHLVNGDKAKAGATTAAGSGAASVKGEDTVQIMTTTLN